MLRSKGALLHESVIESANSSLDRAGPVQLRWGAGRQDDVDISDEPADLAVLRTGLSFYGFLGHSAFNPVVDAYELLVRLHQLVSRAKVLKNATSRLGSFQIFKLQIHSRFKRFANVFEFCQ